MFRFKDKDDKRGKIEFVGSVLFTHFDEIGDPILADQDDHDHSYRMAERSTAT